MMKKVLIISGTVLGLLVLSVIVKQFMTSPPAEPTYRDECDRIYTETGECPDEYCRGDFIEVPGMDGDVMGCVPKRCDQFVGGQCPLGRCQVMVNCAGNEVCRAPSSDNGEDCGGMGYLAQKVECCEGLIHRCGKVISDGSCNMNSSGYGSFPKCLPCGNDICDEPHENKCNCPEDCTE